MVLEKQRRGAAKSAAGAIILRGSQFNRATAGARPDRLVVLRDLCPTTAAMWRQRFQRLPNGPGIADAPITWGRPGRRRNHSARFSRQHHP